MAKVADFDLDKMPFILSRDNAGYVLINVKTQKVWMLCRSPITANLYGHGDILRVVKGAEPGKCRIVTVI